MRPAPSITSRVYLGPRRRCNRAFRCRQREAANERGIGLQPTRVALTAPGPCRLLPHADVTALYLYALDCRKTLLELRVLLVDSHPEIWRQLEVRGSTSLDQVHRILQVAFGWEDAHLHRFTDSDPFAPLRPIDGEVPEACQWLPAQWCEDPADRGEEGCSLDQLLARGSGVAFYEYDFGDRWLHRIELISRRPATKGSPPARMTGGARRGPS